MDREWMVKSELFRGIHSDELDVMLGCLGARSAEFDKGATIYHAGDVIGEVAFILSGTVHIVQVDVWGNQQILDEISAGQVFGEAYACSEGEPMLVSAEAMEPTRLLFINLGRILQRCSSECSFHTRLLRNLLQAMAARNLSLTRKIHHTAPKSIRERVLSYLSYRAVKAGSREFDIPFNRQQMADYLLVERSALSAELSKMRKDGLIEYRKEHFKLNGSLILHMD